MRIAQIAPLWAPIPPGKYGGIELVMKLLIEALVIKGHEVSLFASADCRSPARLIPVCPLNLMDMMKEGSAYSYEYYASCAVASAINRASEYDLIHYHLSPAWLPIASLANVPSLFTLHHSLQIDDVRIIQEWPSVGVAGISRAQISSLAAKSQRKIPVIYNGIDFLSFTPSYSPGSYLVFLGRLSPNKNPLDAIRIAKESGIPLVIAGEPLANEHEYFHECIKPLIDGKDIIFIGPVDHEQKNDLLANASALLFPIAWDEPFGLVMIEAMACGTPVIATARSSVTEIVDHGVTGYYADSIEKLQRLLPMALNLNREEVRSHAESRFSHSTMAHRYMQLYSEIAQSNSTP
jgi:glycosyltransferase involved in cell wall biosynthesis